MEICIRNDINTDLEITKWRIRDRKMTSVSKTEGCLTYLLTYLLLHTTYLLKMFTKEKRDYAVIG